MKLLSIVFSTIACAFLVNARVFQENEDSDVLVFKFDKPNDTSEIIKDALNSKNKYLNNFKVSSLKTKKINTLLPNYSTESKFNITITCVESYSNNEITNVACQKYKDQLPKIEEILENTFEIYQSINIDVKIENLCDYYLEGGDSILGRAYSPSFIPLREENNKNSPLYLYPQALAKQLKLDKEIEYSDIDIEISLNSCKNLENEHFIVLLHEIMHGFGMFTTGTLLSERLYTYVNEDGETEINKNIDYFITDRMINYGSRNNKTDFSVSPLSVFDKYIVANDNSDEYLLNDFSLLYKDIKHISNSTEELSINEIIDFYLNYYNNSSIELLEKAKNIANLYKKWNSVSFKASNGVLVPLQTFDNEYYMQSSICHIHSEIPCIKEGNCMIPNNEGSEMYFDKEYLMYSMLTSNKSNEELLELTNSASPFGPKLMELLKTIGWTEKNTKRNDKVYYTENSKYFEGEDTSFGIKNYLINKNILLIATIFFLKLIFV